MADALNVMDLEGIANREISSAIGFQDAAIRDRQSTCLDRYYGLPLGNEVDGQSKVVTRDVLTTIEWMLPPLMRTFVGSVDAVEFVPRGQEDEEIAKQMTDYVNYVFNNDNDGFRIIYDSMKDGLLTAAGVAKVYYEREDSWSAAETLSGLDDVAFSLLVNEPDVEVMEHSASGGVVMGPDGVAIPQPVMHDVTIRRKRSEPKFCVECIPPEEFFVSGDAKGDIEKARCVGSRTQKTVSDLVAMGFDYELVKDLPKGTSYDWRALERGSPNSTLNDGIDDPADETQQYVWVSEAFVKADVDGDGISECVRCIVAGDCGNGKLLAYELVDGHPYAFWSPVPMPHEQYGLSVAELVLDVQDVKTTLLRQTLNNLYLTNVPACIALDGAIVNQDALIDRKPGAVIFAKRPDAVTPITVPFVASQSFQMMDYWDAEADKRTGVSGAQGLDPNMLQNTTAAAAAATMSAAQQRIELIARQYAEFMRQIFKKLLVLIVRHQDKARTIRLRNKWVTIDPRYWSADMDVSINVGLGNGNKDLLAAHLGMIAQKQEMIIQLAGVNNPLAGPQEYYNTLSKMVEAIGYKNPQLFFKDPSMQPPQPPQPPQPDPKLVEVQQKAALEQQKAMASVSLEREKMLADVALQREKMLADRALEEQKMRYELDLQRAQLEAEYRLKKEAMREKEDDDEDDTSGSSDMSDVGGDIQFGGDLG